MDINLEPGKYVVAVSGGVDSVGLLHILKKNECLDLVVAHLDHGIRKDSAKDYEFVKKLANASGLEFVGKKVALGSDASEASAREKRYEFLHRIRREKNAAAVVTAHHSNDVIETAAINMLRGTNRKGLSSLGSGGHVIRPLLGMKKSQIKEYAVNNKLIWREDSSNNEQTYLRNRIRRILAAKGTREQNELLRKIDSARLLNNQIDETINKVIDKLIYDGKLKRRDYIAFPHTISKELLAEWLRREDVSFDAKRLECLAVEIKTKTPGTRLDIDKSHYYKIGREQISLETR